VKRLLAFAVFACITGCAPLQGPPATAKDAPLGPGEILSAQAAKNAVVVGQSTKADVRAALGEAVVIDFASGYDVWVYRERASAKPPQDKSAPQRNELVLLFAPSGVLAKMRVSEAK